MLHRKSLWTGVGLFLLGIALVPGVTAYDNPARTTYLTFSKPVRLPGVVLGSGTYIFERATLTGDATIVRVMSRDRRTSYFMGFTKLVDRPRGLSPNALVSIGETARGSAPPITNWWPMNESTGHEFGYQ